ncbi:MAG: histidine--tRNA ligase [Dehalococcoidales bacterium]|nr:histidine--tRNA ligase [Dehalococcoidales bacterium]
MYQAPRGTADILPVEQPYWRYVERAIEEITRRYGYRRIDTPVFEETGLFRRSAGDYTDIVQKEMYTFEDRGGVSLTLKPEGTPAVCRAYLEHGMHNLPPPVKLYYISPIFRYDRPQAGRYRQHHQFGAEAIGSADPALDAEVIDMAWQFYRLLGLSGLTLELNSIGCKTCRPGYLAALKDYYCAHVARLCADCKARFEKNPLRLLDCKEPSCQEIADNAPRGLEHLCPDCSAHFAALQKYLAVLGIPATLNHRLVRGLDYYTRTVFEFQPSFEGRQSTIGGGGRYDDLIVELGGRPTPACGFATGIERIIINLKRQGLELPPPPAPAVFIAFIGEAAKEAAVRLAGELRREGIPAALGFGERSLKGRMREADASGARYAVIIGDEELAGGTVTLRDMRSATQEKVPAAALIPRLRRDIPA